MIKKLIKVIREYKKETLLTPFFVMLEVIMEVLIPIVMASLIDEGFGENMNIDAIYKYGFILIICAVMALIFGVLSGKYAAKARCWFW